MHLGVLTEQTLEISSVVKDPTQPGPSLVTEVKDSSLTILHQLPFSCRGSWRSRAHFWWVFAKLGHTFLSEEFVEVCRLQIWERSLFRGIIYTQGTSLHQYWSGFFNPFIPSLRRVCFSLGGHIVPRGSSDLEWEITPNRLETYHRGFLVPDL